MMLVSLLHSLPTVDGVPSDFGPTTQGTEEWTPSEPNENPCRPAWNTDSAVPCSLSRRDHRRMHSRWMQRGLLLLVAASTSHSGVRAAVPLPAEFSVVLGVAGVDLIWSPMPANATGGTSSSATNAHVVRIGGSRKEFRLSNGTLLGYPRESQPSLWASGSLVAFQ